MSQKTNPTALRLLRNETSFHSSWFSDFFYGEITLHENEIRLYLEQLFKETNYSCSIICLQNFYRKSPISLFLHDIRATRREKEFSLRVPRNSRPLYANYFCEKQGEARTKQYVLDFVPKRRSAELQSSLPREALHAMSFLKAREKMFGSLHPRLLSHKKYHTNFASLGFAKQARHVQIGAKQGFAPFKALCLCMLGQTYNARTEQSSVRLGFQERHTFVILLNFWVAKQTQNKGLFFVERALNFDGSYKAKKALLSTDSKQSSDIREMLQLDSPHKRLSYQNKALPFFIAKLCQAQQFDTNLIGQPFLQSKALYANIAFTYLEPIRVVSDVQNAWILLDQIVNLLQKRAAFRQIKQKIFSELSKNTQIKGVRLSCRGRFGGRSKKAQKSKTQKDYWGETSLHAFSSRVSFASKNANTPFGKIGIKLWLSFA